MLLLSSLFLSAALSAHPMHVAYSNIEIDPARKTVSVSHKVYSNDFTLLFFHLFEKNIIPNDTAEFTEPELKLIDLYMKERFILVADKDTIPLNYVNKKLDEEFLWLNFSGHIREKEITDLTINNLLMLDLYMDQKNLVIINFGQIEKGLAFSWENRQSVFVLKE